MSEAPKNVYQRLAATMAEVDYIQKERKSGMNYTIVSHDAVTAKVRPALLRNGIVYFPTRCEHLQNGNRAECSMTVRFVNVDEPADHFDVQTFGYGIDTQDKGPGKAMSYAVKYALLKALGLETGDDPDTESKEFSKDDAHQTPSAKSSAQLKREDVFPKVRDELANEMLDVHTFGQFEEIKGAYRQRARVEGWNTTFLAQLGELFEGHAEELQKRIDAQNAAPADLSNNSYAKAFAGG